MAWIRTSARRVRSVENKLVPIVSIVDDDADLLNYAALVLGHDYLVQNSTNGADALRIARNARPDVIVLDAMMPGAMDGFTTFCELKKNPETAHIKVLMLTEVNKVTQLSFGADTMQEYFGEAP